MVSGPSAESGRERGSDQERPGAMSNSESADRPSRASAQYRRLAFALLAFFVLTVSSNFPISLRLAHIPLRNGDCLNIYCSEFLGSPIPSATCNSKNS